MLEIIISFNRAKPAHAGNITVIAVLDIGHCFNGSKRCAQQQILEASFLLSSCVASFFTTPLKLL